ncbi:hypothetical protein [Streptomyces cavourensis]|uniref:hypothetical protein n=1 Tax=Streptomyces cavourensis TaxID=67258 RepID=UPI000DC65EF9|nr:hypothetical protein [Streptomyces cavourensis]ATY97212.1 hypothetical protein CVT27_18480 [Streptomyces cavourensis]
MRLRITRTTWPRPALVLTDTPRPRCPDCQGAGGHTVDYGDHNGEYAGTDWWPCPCWDDTRRWTLLPLPRRTGWRDPWGNGGYSDEPPF